MRTVGYTTRALPFLSDFSTKDRRLAETAFSQQEERQRKANESRGKKHDEILEDLRRQFHDLLGARKSAELRKAIRRERLAFRDLWQPPAGLGRNYAKHKTASKRKIEALFRKFGANAEKLKKLRKEFHEKLEGILSAAVGKVVQGYNLANNLDKWTSLSPLHEYALPWGIKPPFDDPNDPHRWFLFRPPFFGFLFSFVPQATNHFVADRLLFLHPPSGLVGNEVTLDASDPGDYGAASGTAEAQMAFGFEAPITGLVEVLIDAQSTIGTHDIEIEDNFDSQMHGPTKITSS
jgi:hypothetical protein